MTGSNKSLLNINQNQSYLYSSVSSSTKLSGINETLVSDFLSISKFQKWLFFVVFWSPCKYTLSPVPHCAEMTRILLRSQILSRHELEMLLSKGIPRTEGKKRILVLIVFWFNKSILSCEMIFSRKWDGIFKCFSQVEGITIPPLLLFCGWWRFWKSFNISAPKLGIECFYQFLSVGCSFLWSSDLQCCKFTN